MCALINLLEYLLYIDTLLKKKIATQNEMHNFIIFMLIESSDVVDSDFSTVKYLGVSVRKLTAIRSYRSNGWISGGRDFR